MITLDLAKWLASPNGERFWKHFDPTESELAQIARMRKLLSPQEASAVLEAGKLALKASRKFSGRTWLCTAKGLEQATDAAVSAYKASRLPPGVPAADYCCGIGGDLVAMASRGPATGIDADPVLVEFANYNLRSCGLYETSRAVASDAADVDPRDFAVWHIDPDRRSGDSRFVSVNDSHPNLDTLLQLLGKNPHAVWKLAPACEAPPDLQTHAERAWVTFAGECRSQLLWFGCLAATPGDSRAVRVDHQGRTIGAFRWREETPLVAAPHAEAYLIEPDVSILAGQGAGPFAQSIGASALTPRGGYLTSQEACLHSMAAVYRVMDVMPARLEKLKSRLHELGAGEVTVKKRGVEIEPAKWSRQLRGPGEIPFVVCCYREGKKSVAVIGRRMNDDARELD